MRPSESEIRQRSYFIWESEGCPQGHAWDHWMRAEKELQQQLAPLEPTASKRKKTSALIGEKTSSRSKPKQR